MNSLTLRNADAHKIACTVILTIVGLIVLTLYGLSRAIQTLADLLTLDNGPNATLTPPSVPVGLPLNGQFDAPATVFPIVLTYCAEASHPYTFSTMTPESIQEPESCSLYRLYELENANNRADHTARLSRPSPVVAAIVSALTPAWTPIPQVEIIPASETVVATAANPASGESGKVALLKAPKAKSPRKSRKADKTEEIKPTLYSKIKGKWTISPEGTHRQEVSKGGKKTYKPAS